MATILGDVQYSQNGTFTNPCEINLTIQLLKIWGTSIYGTPHSWLESTPFLAQAPNRSRLWLLVIPVSDLMGI